MEDLTVVEGGSQAGAVVWWELHGTCLVDELALCLEDEGLMRADLIPKAPSPEVALLRAAQANVTSKALVRSTGPRTWEAFEEKRIKDANGNNRVVLDSLAVGQVNRTRQGHPVDPYPLVTAMGKNGERFVGAVIEDWEAYKVQLCPDDVSSWLLGVANTKFVQAVSLRSRGGFYFVPNACLPFWRSVERAVHLSSGSVMRQLPAMKTEECAKAVLASVRREAEEAFGEMETYLASKVSTKGLNAVERRVAAVQEKIQSYVALFETETLADFKERSDILVGALAAARLARDSEARNGV